MSAETPAEEVRRTRDQLIDCALEDVIAEKRMRGVPSKVMAADDKLAIAARNHARAIDALEPVRQPKGWHDPAEVTS